MPPAPQPIRWPARLWLDLYFGDRDSTSGLSLQFHRILSEDPELRGSDFSAFVQANRSRLGDLVIDPDGMLVCESAGEQTILDSLSPERHPYLISPRTAFALIALYEQQRGARSLATPLPMDEQGTPMPIDNPGPPESDPNLSPETYAPPPSAPRPIDATYPPWLSEAGRDIPRVIGQYEIHSLVGRGGMGVVYRARHRALDREVAIKVLPGARFNDPKLVARLMREAKLGASLLHPGICQVLDAGQIEGDFYFVMEFLHGQDLSRLLRSHEVLPIGLACHFARQLFEILSYLGRAEIVHRDIKPGNLFVTPGDRLKLLDLGLAKELQEVDGDQHTRSGVALGTPAYMAPEQILDSKNVDSRADLYSAGATFYEMVTGRLPYSGGNIAELLHKALNDYFPDPRSFRPELPAPLADLILRLLSKDRADRPTADEVLEVLSAYRDERAWAEEAAFPLPTAKYLPRRRRYDTESGEIDVRAGDGSTNAPPSESAEEMALPPSPSGCLLVLLRVVARFAQRVGEALKWASNGIRFRDRPATRKRRSPRPRVESEFPSERKPRPDQSPSSVGRRSAVLAGLAEAKARFDDSRDGNLLELLPKVDGKPCVGQYVLEESLGLVRTPVHTYLARQAQSGFECIVRLLPLALAALAPEKLKQLRTKKKELIGISRDCDFLTRLLTVEKVELQRGNYRNLYYTVEDWSPGRSFEQVIAESHPVSVPDLAEYLRQSVVGLKALHDRRLLHGNLHPGKLYLDAATARVRINDLSHACEFQSTGEHDFHPFTQAIHGLDVLGDRSAKRRRYLAPEILYGAGKLGPHAEQFALGVIFLEALGGRLTSGGQTIDRHDYSRQVDLQDLLDEARKRDQGLEAVLRRMVNIDAKRRYPNLEVLLQDLAGLMVGAGTAPSPPVRPPEPVPPAPAPPKPKRNPPPVTVLQPMSEEIRLAEVDYDRLLKLLSNQASAYPDGPKVFFEELLARSKLPKNWQRQHTQTLNLSPDPAARRLVDWALMKKRHPDVPQLTVLGSLLRPLLPELDFHEARFVVALIAHHQLYQPGEYLQALAKGYLIPQPVPEFDGETVELGPDITWQGTVPEEVSFQSWRSSPPPLLDVGFLQRVLEQTAAICRVEPPDDNLGTGFLISKDLVLTCYHVLADPGGNAIDQHARDTRVRFGCFTESTGEESKGQVFRLAPNPIVERSPTLDYLLLRIDASIRDAKDLRPVKWNPSLPALRQPLNILQHPEGTTMKVALCPSGITAVDSATSIVQYVTSARSGSSGAPCFNDSWEVVAMHHAQRSRTFGTVREGILFQAILREIEKHLI